VIDSEVLVGAPLPMTRSGLGDQLSMFTAAADWYLASAVGFDPSFSRTVVDIQRAGGEDLLANAGDLAYGGQRAVLSLANALTRGGLAMGLAGRTAPSSGTEHTVSHLLEMSAAGRRRAHASHGSQVGVASVVARRCGGGCGTGSPSGSASQPAGPGPAARARPRGIPATGPDRDCGRRVLGRLPAETGLDRWPPS